MGLDPAKALKAAIVIGAAACTAVVNLGEHGVIELPKETRSQVGKIGASLGLSLVVHQALTKLEGKK